MNGSQNLKIKLKMLRGTSYDSANRQYLIKEFGQASDYRCSVAYCKFDDSPLVWGHMYWYGQKKRDKSHYYLICQQHNKISENEFIIVYQIK